MSDAAYQVIYNSDLVVNDPTVLVTCCVFYDTLVLPYITLGKDDSMVVTRGGSAVGASVDFSRTKYLAEWNERYSELFTSSVLIRLCRPDETVPKVSPWFRTTDEMTKDILDVVHVELTGGPGPDALQGISEDLLSHLMRHDLSLPEIFISRYRRPPRDILLALEARSIFRYLLPALNELHSEEILEVRDRVSDTREGFTMHLQKLSKGLDDKLRNSEPLEELIWWADNLVATELVPDYREFRRQFRAERTGILGKALDATGKFFEIDAAPWTPKFYAQLMRAFGALALSDGVVEKERLTNRAQAFQFMSLVEGSSLQHA